MVEAPTLEPAPQSDDKHPSVWLRTGINLLSAYRAHYSFELHDRLITTPPAERDSKGTRKTGAVGVGDFLDGYLSGVFGTGELGKRLDELADKLLAYKAMRALKEAGEVSVVDANISIGSDLAAIGLRAVASMKDLEVASSLTGKARTAVNLANWTVADSTLAQNPDNIRQGVSIANGLAITSRVEYGLGFVQALRARRRDSEPASEEEATARNSGLRKFFGEHINDAVEFMHAKDLKADHLTRAGEVLVWGSAAMVARNPDKVVLPTTLFTIGSLLDALDGSLARLEKGEHGTTDEGMLRDLRADRRQEIIAFCGLAFIAKRRGNEVAARNYLAAAMTATLPSLAKAQVETDGWIVQEGAVGGSVVRKVLTGAGMAFNRNQEITDKLSGAAFGNNVVTAWGRLQVASKGKEAECYKGRTDDEEFMRQAQLKRDTLLKMTGAGIVAGAVMAKLLDIEMPFTVPDQSDPAQTAESPSMSEHNR
jgi:phosphatidylglycerophosphate synthase